VVEEGSYEELVKKENGYLNKLKIANEI